MSKFHNPYHFVPLAGEPPGLVSTKEFEVPSAKDGSPQRDHPHLTHDRYVEGTHSGKLTCRVTVETPLICGNGQKERNGWTKLIEPFTLDGETPALPASGLRGEISSIIEAVTNSSLRVLTKETAKGLNIHDYFSGISHHLLPLSPTREAISIAEQMLGVVEIRDEDRADSRNSAKTFALASRVRFGHGTLGSPKEKCWIEYKELLTDAQKGAVSARNGLGVLDLPLQNLASPKPPSPSLYFKLKNGQGGYLSKESLQTGAHHPHGRKFYLRRNSKSYSASSSAFVHPDRLATPKEHKTLAEQHQSVEKLVRPGTVFSFEIQFDNLSDLELQVLAYSLQPNGDFRHMLGHGKPLGLGQVRIEISRLDLVNRRQRYLDDLLTSGRFHEKLTDEVGGGVSERVEKLIAEFRTWAAKQNLTAVLEAMELIGRPVSDDEPIHYPQTDKVTPKTAAFESEHFRWFVQNDKINSRRLSGQFLAPLVNSGGQVATSLPLLFRKQSDSPPETTPSHSKGQPPASVKASVGKVSHSGRTVGSAACPTHLHGKRGTATVLEYGRNAKGKFAIKFDVTCEGYKLIGSLQKSDPFEDKKHYPERSGTVYEFEILNPQGEAPHLTCQLRPLPED